MNEVSRWESKNDKTLNRYLVRLCRALPVKLCKVRSSESIQGVYLMILMVSMMTTVRCRTTIREATLAYYVRSRISQQILETTTQSARVHTRSRVTPGKTIPREASVNKIYSSTLGRDYGAINVTTLRV